MATKNRIFTSFAIEDRSLRDMLRGQARNENSSFEFVDMSVKEPWSSDWKNNCRTRIKGCDGIIAIITNNTPAASGEIWEIQCGIDERLPILAIQGYANEVLRPMPAPVNSLKIYSWTWPNISSFLQRI